MERVNRRPRTVEIIKTAKAIATTLIDEVNICLSISSSDTIYLIAPAMLPSVLVTVAVIAMTFSPVSSSLPVQIAFPVSEFIASRKSGIF